MNQPKSSSPRIVIVIPARYASTRFPGKPLALIRGIPMIVRTFTRASRAVCDRIFVATDHPEIRKTVAAAGGEVVMTDPELPSGTDRIAAAVKSDPADIIVNVQGDEPFLDPGHINLAVGGLLNDPSASVSTLAAPIDTGNELWNENIVKVMIDSMQHAVYFSRIPIPFPGQNLKDRLPLGTVYYRHIGLYVYRRRALERFVNSPPCDAEKIERLEQLRIMMNGEKIRVETVEISTPGVDVPEDIDRLNYWIEKSGHSIDSLSTEEVG